MTDVAEYRKRCRDIAGSLEYRGYCGGVIAVGLAIFTASLVWHAPGPKAFLLLLFAIHLLAAIAALALSVLLYFDAHLFRRMAKYPDEMAGGASVDRYLADRRLKPMPNAVRPLVDRIAGSQRWSRRQLVAAGIATASALLVLALHLA